jgi:hypothetical protein
MKLTFTSTKCSVEACRDIASENVAYFYDMGLRYRDKFTLTVLGIFTV